MIYAVGDAVVFARHGATLVHEVSTRIIAGVEREYVVLRYPFHRERPDVVATVPVEGGLVVPLAEVACEKGIGEAMAGLAVPGPHVESRFAERRHRSYLIMLGGQDEEEPGDLTLDIRQVAVVVRNLTFRRNVRGLADDEEALLDSARTVFVSELALARGLDVYAATAQLDEALMAQRVKGGRPAFSAGWG
jgi:CarD family transcriptional regulator